MTIEELIARVEELKQARKKALEEAAALVDAVSELAWDGVIGGRTIREEKQALLNDVARSIRALGKE